MQKCCTAPQESQPNIRRDDSHLFPCCISAALTYAEFSHCDAVNILQKRSRPRLGQRLRQADKRLTLKAPHYSTGTAGLCNVVLNVLSFEEKDSKKWHSKEKTSALKKVCNRITKQYPGFVGSEAYKIFGSLFKKKNTKLQSNIQVLLCLKLIKFLGPFLRKRIQNYKAISRFCGVWSV